MKFAMLHGRGGLDLACLFAFLVMMIDLTGAQAQDSNNNVKTYVGPLTGAPASARIAVVAQDDSIVAYVCSGDQTFNQSYCCWLKGTLTKGELSAEATDGLKLTGRLKDNFLEVKLTHPSEKALAFQAKELAARTIAGLYRAEHKTPQAESVYGWIIDQDHNAVGAQRVIVIKKTPPKSVIVRTAATDKKLPPPTGMFDAKRFIEQENLAAEVVRDNQGGVVIQSQRVIAVQKLPQGSTKK